MWLEHAEPGVRARVGWLHTASLRHPSYCSVSVHNILTSKTPYSNQFLAKPQDIGKCFVKQIKYQYQKLKTVSFNLSINRAKLGLMLSVEATVTPSLRPTLCNSHQHSMN